MLATQALYTEVFLFMVSLLFRLCSCHCWVLATQELYTEVFLLMVSLLFSRVFFSSPVMDELAFVMCLLISASGDKFCDGFHSVDYLVMS